MAGDDQVDALLYAYTSLYNKHTHTTGAQAPSMGPLPDSLGYCPWCHELVECHAREWQAKDGPECGRHVDRGQGKHSWCANPLKPLQGHPVGDLIWASYVLGGRQAAELTWHDHGTPALAQRF